MSSTAHNASGSVVSLWRYPVKSMMGEELNSSDVTERGLLGDRAYALVDSVDGKIVSAKNPRKWGNLFDFRAAFVEPPRSAKQLPPVRITLPNGTIVSSAQDDINRVLSHAAGREVTLERSEAQEEIVETEFPNPWRENPSLEEYWPDIEGLAHRDAVTDEKIPEGTFFDCAVIHVLTTATIDRLRELYPQGRFEVRRFRPNIVVGTWRRTGSMTSLIQRTTLLLSSSVRVLMLSRTGGSVVMFNFLGFSGYNHQQTGVETNGTLAGGQRV
ncbi:MAG TPA: MOSC N-terminal beta barrel domain-containing protein [Pyrinomonadaceae bacterium]|nr:MOSC N-terminal beta barrel domain-containing protein [Pyrinomonadaceae bacterium]